MNIPKHVAIILDGNGRWAKKRGMPRTYGHARGAKNVENIVRAAHDLGIQYLTVYAFSTENWSRPDEEVNALMKLLRDYLRTCMNTVEKNNMCVRIIGDKTRLAPDIRDAIRELEEYSSQFDGIYFQIAVNYGARDEIVRAVRKTAEDVQKGILEPEDITQETISARLDTADIPDPDLLIRTGGEERLSNYLLWQLAYAEFYFTDVMWPDFDKDELVKAIEVFQSRQRRFGGV